MHKDPRWLSAFQENIYSQTGEDGIIEKILEMLPVKDNWAVEFGAADGYHDSNTLNLIEKHGYSAVLIESQLHNYDRLADRFSKSPSITTLNTVVGFDNENKLDAILRQTPIPKDFDFLSIDVDGNDYHIWEAVAVYAPKLVCIEYNPTIPTAIEFVQEKNMEISQGSSLRSLYNLAKQKGYEMVSVTALNAFFVKKEYFPLFQIYDNRPEVLCTNADFLTFIFSGYDGTVFLRGYKKLPWHNLPLIESRMQVLPKFIRRYPPRYNRIIYLILLLIRKGLCAVNKKMN